MLKAQRFKNFAFNTRLIRPITNKSNDLRRALEAPSTYQDVHGVFIP